MKTPNPSLLLKKELEKFKLICLLPSALELHATAINLLKRISIVVKEDILRLDSSKTKGVQSRIEAIERGLDLVFG